MSTAESVVRWLQGSKSPVPPDLLLHPADVFPLATLSNPPSSTDSDSDCENDDGSRHARRNIASLVHPPTPKSMEDQTAATQARRRSSSLVGALGPPQHPGRKHRRRRSDNILEEGEDGSSDSDSASSARTDSDHLELDNMSADGLQDDEETGLTGGDRRRRRRRKRRNTLLDQRIVPSEVHFSKEEEKIANQNVIQSMLINALLIGLWYVPPALPSSSHAKTDTEQVSLLHLHFCVQQMDVQGGQGRRQNREHLSISAFHDMSAYGRPVYARIARFIRHTIASTAARFP